MRTTKKDRLNALMERMFSIGIMPSETTALLSAEKALQRWSESECGNEFGHTERDDDGKPWRVVHRFNGPDSRYRCRDMEAAALRRIATVMSSHPECWFYHQHDPRGCALYVGKKDGTTENSLHSLYTRGIAVCV